MYDRGLLEVGQGNLVSWEARGNPKGRPVLVVPTREALLLAVYQEEIESLGASVDRLLDQKPPLEAFCASARKLAELVRLKHGLGEALENPAAKAVIDATYVLLLLSALWRVPPARKG